VGTPWTERLVDANGNVTPEFGIVCAALVLVAWIALAPGAVWGMLVVLHPKRCAIGRAPMSLA
jgi:hypothetical protein